MLTCYSCSKQKNELHAKKSIILPGVNLLMCQTCIDSKFEPRWVIILAGRKNGPSHVRDFIVKNKYIGKEISAHELIV
jgi:hypothetical protein